MADIFEGHKLALPYQTIGELLGRYAERHPAKTAIVDLDQKSSITFRELNEIVLRVAADLKARGVKKGSRVLLLSDEYLEKLVLWFATWRLGAVVCPLNIELNEKHLAELTAIIRPDVIFFHKDLDGAALTGGHPAPTFRFGGLKDDPSDDYFRRLSNSAPQVDLPDRNEAGDLSCMFCTSGTTSKPKIVVYDHAAYWLSGLDTIDILGLTDADKTLEYRSFGWNSAQILSLMPFLQTGLTLHMAKRFSHSKFFEWIQNYSITFAAGVPTVVNMLLNKPLGYSAKDIPSLRLMTCSTAPLTGEQWARFEEMYGITLLQLYGMSEAGWICGNRHYRRKIGTVGPPALHQDFEIVDPQGAACPPDLEGEVTVGGTQVAIGYLMDDGSIDPVRGRRIKTGDLAIIDGEGFVRITGRTKDLIIRGGMNIAPLEIDDVLLRHPDIFDAAVVGVPDPIYGEEVVGYVVAKPGSQLNENSVIEHCKAYLPAAKLPKQLFFVHDLPKSDRGKVLRDKLKTDWMDRQKNPA